MCVPLCMCLSDCMFMIVCVCLTVFLTVCKCEREFVKSVYVFDCVCI